MCWHLETMSSRQFVHTECILLLVLTGIIQHYLSLKNYFCRVQIESFLANFYTIHLNIIVLILCYALLICIAVKLINTQLGSLILYTEAQNLNILHWVNNQLCVDLTIQLYPQRTHVLEQSATTIVSSGKDGCGVVSSFTGML